MVALAKFMSSSVADAAQAAASKLVTVHHWAGSSFVSLPLLYPSSDFVAVKLDQAGRGRFRVSDNGLAFREVESIGAQRSFVRTANTLMTEDIGLQVDRRVVFCEVSGDQLVRAICDVGIASWQIADRVFSRAAEDDEADIQEYLRDRLHKIFPQPVEADDKIVGSSTTEWDVSAIVKLPNRLAVFHAVSNHASSVFKASAAFHDLSALDTPPALIAVVRNKAALGSKLGILAQAGRVIEETDSDATYVKAAA